MRWMSETGSCTCSRRDANGGPFRKTCRRAARCSPLSIYGFMTGPWIACTTRFTKRAASKPAARPALPPALSKVILRQVQDEGVKSAEPFGKLRRGACIDPPGFDAGNPSANSGDQGQEAAHSRLYRGTTAACHRACRRYSRSRRRSSSVDHALWPVSFFEEAVRRQRLPRPALQQGRRQNSNPTRHRNRQTFRPSQGFRRSAKALDRRTNDPPGFNPGVNRCRRLAKDWENLNVKALAFLRFASIRLMLRKLCHPS